MKTKQWKALGLYLQEWETRKGRKPSRTKYQKKYFNFTRTRLKEEVKKEKEIWHGLL